MGMGYFGGCLVAVLKKTKKSETFRIEIFKSFSNTKNGKKNGHV